MNARHSTKNCKRTQVHAVLSAVFSQRTLHQANCKYRASAQDIKDCTSIESWDLCKGIGWWFALLSVVSSNYVTFGLKI